MADPTPVRRPRRERIIRKVATLIVKGVYRKVDVYVYHSDVEAIDVPRVSVSNHFGGFADPLLLVYAAPRLPRVIARDVIWKFPPARWVMNWARAIPVHKPEDRGAGSNDVMFSSAYGALEEGSHLMIFPEGITRDEPSIGPVKTGAARIVLGARANGVEGIQITPAGIYYENKAALRSDVSIQIGASINLDETIERYVGPGADEGPENRNLVHRLTDDIEAQLRHVAPDFSDWDDARTMADGAEILLRSLADDPADPVPLAERDYIAGYLGRRPEADRDKVTTAVGSYQRELSDLGLTDAQLLSDMTGRHFLWRLIGWLILSVVLLPFAVVGAVINWIPYLIVKAVGLMRAAPAMLATVKPLTAIVAFGITWAVTVWGAFRTFGTDGAGLAALLMPVYLGAVIVFVERVQALWAAFRAWRGLRSVTELEDFITSRRGGVVENLLETL